MYCLASKDQPLRIQLSKTGVIHAGSRSDYGGFTRWLGNGRKEKIPKQKVIRVACRWAAFENDMEDFLVSNRETITCKSCISRMGMDEGPVAPKRYVVRRKDTGEFMKNTSSRCSGWSESITDAFFFRREHTAKDKCKRQRYQAGDESMTYVEWRKAGYPKCKRERIHDPNLEIKSVKFTIE